MHKYFSIISFCLLLSVSVPAFAQKKNRKTGEPETTVVSLKSQQDSLTYAIGVSIGGNLKTQGLDSINFDLLKLAMEQSAQGKTLLLSQEEAGGYVNNYFMNLQKEKGSKAKEKGKQFLAENKSKPGVQTTTSGLQYLVITEGTGPIPKPTDKVKTHYHGTLVDGTVFDSSVQRGEPISFPVNGVIKGWTEALQLMKVGSKWKLFIPSELAYGENGAGGAIGPNEALIFDVELIAIEP